MNKALQATIILSLCGIFLFLKYIAQLFPSLISEELVHQFHLSGVGLGVVASCYYYSYSLMQLISGILLDKYNVRISATIAILCVSLGLLGFSATDSFYMMCLYRALMGAGCAFATCLYMKCTTIWTDEKWFPIISSLLATATMLGAAVGSEPIAILFESTGWNKGLNLIGILGLFLSILSFLFIKNNKTIKSNRTANLSDLKEVLKRSANRWLLVYTGLTFSPVVILGGLWGIPFLQLKFHASSTVVAKLISIMFIGHAVGSPIWALLSNYFDNKKDLMRLANVMSFGCLIVLIYGTPTFNQAELLFFIFGLSVGCFMLSFSICRSINPVVSMGFAVAFINTGEGIVGSLLEPGIGWILDLMKSSPSSGFSLLDYQYGLLILPLCYIMSTFVIAKLPDSKVSSVSHSKQSFAI